jgi:excisionase family DNA binding protein
MNEGRDTPMLFHIQEVARILSISRSVVYTLMRDRKLGSVTIGRSRRVTGDQIRQYVESLQQ